MKTLIIIILTGLVTSGFLYIRIENPFAKPGRYKFLFRKTLFSERANVYPTRKSIYELAPVIQGRVYMPNYFFMPVQNQYLVRSSLDFSQIPRHDPYAPKTKESVKRYVLLDGKGHVLRSLDTKVNFSRYSGLFFATTHYLNWLQTGETTQIPYDTIYNQDLNMSQDAFVARFRELYKEADYVEYVNLRTQYNDKIEAGIVFKIRGKWNILLSGLSDSRMRRKYTEEDEKTAIWEDIYRVSFNYNDPASKEKEPYPPSPASMQIIPLETEMEDPYNFNRVSNTFGKRELVMDKYLKGSSTGWIGVGKANGVPIYIPGTSSGIAYMRLNLGKETFRFKIPDVEKTDYLPRYNLGVRLFKLPEHLRNDSSLVFLESTQNGGEDRLGGGVYVVREHEGENLPDVSGDLPEGISEKRFAQLPLTLQQALIDREETTELLIESGRTLEWYPEIELLKNLTYLNIRAGLTEIPDGIGKLQKLKVLILEYNDIKKISPEISKLDQLKILNLYSNDLEGFPECLLMLKNLEELSIGANKGITEIPAEIGDFHDLRSLNLGQTSISSLPDEIAKLHNLRYLSLLSLYDITSLPEAMSEMKELTIRADHLEHKLPEKFRHLFVFKNP